MVGCQKYFQNFWVAIISGVTGDQTWQIPHGQHPRRCWEPQVHENKWLRGRSAYGIYKVAVLPGGKNPEFCPTTKSIFWYLGQSIFKLYKTYFQIVVVGRNLKLFSTWKNCHVINPIGRSAAKSVIFVNLGLPIEPWMLSIRHLRFALGANTKTSPMHSKTLRSG